jgi:hypothetical protein
MQFCHLAVGAGKILRQRGVIADRAFGLLGEVRIAAVALILIKQFDSPSIRRRGCAASV